MSDDDDCDQEALDDLVESIKNVLDVLDGEESVTAMIIVLASCTAHTLCLLESGEQATEEFSRFQYIVKTAVDRAIDAGVVPWERGSAH